MNDDSQPLSEFKSKSGPKRILSAFFYSIDGLRTAWRYEHAFRQELAITVPGMVVALMIPVTALERVILIGVLLLVGASGFSYEEAAEICQCAVGTIKSRVNRARTKLAEILSIDGPEDLSADARSRSVTAQSGA